MNSTFNHLKQSTLLFAFVLLSLVAGCNSSGDPILSNGGSTTGAITTVTAVTPIKDATDIAVNIKKVTASFSIEMDPVSLNTTSFTLMQGATIIAGTSVAYDAIGSIATLTLPAADLLHGTIYTATITTVASGINGVALANDYVWTFTTGAFVDITPPTVVSTAAYGVTGDTSGKTNLLINRSSSATFSEDMDPLSLTTPPAFTVFNETLSLSVPGLVTYNIANKTSTFKPDTTLDYSTLYTSKISTDAKDVAGNALAADYSWSWTTAANKTTVSITTPEKNASNVPLNIRKITASFNKEMDPASIDITSFTLVHGAGATPVAADTVAYVALGSVATFNLPLGNLLSNTAYTATVTTLATGLDGIALAVDYVWTFTTGTVIDSTPPTVISTAAYGNTGDTSGKIDLPVNRSSSATFSEPMDVFSLTTLPAFTLENDNLGTAVLGVVTYNVASKTITFKPDADLDPQTLYIATITTAAKDSAGNPLVVNYVWEWTTGDLPDTTRPTVMMTAPLNMAIDVFLDQSVNATFSEEMDPNTINDLSFLLTDMGVAVDGIISYDALNKIATLKPDVDLKPSTLYIAIIKSDVSDLAGNQLEGNQLPLPPAASDYEWEFTTGTAIVPAANLGLAETFGVAATAGITNAGATQINGDVVLNPSATCNAVPADNAGGFGLCGGFAPTIDGEVITPTYPDLVTAQAVTDALRAAYLEITPANMPGATPIAAPTTLGAPVGNAMVEGDNLFFPGVYESITSILISGDLTLDAQGDANATFVFQSGSTIGTAPGARILLVNGAKSSNVWWQAGSDATLQTDTTWHGNILAYRSITMLTLTESCGRLFAGAGTDGAFVFDSNTVSVPGHANAPSCK